MAIERILEKLEKVKRTGSNEYLARCPAHDDNSPSLTLKEISDERVLIHCFAGCGGSEVMQAIGMTLEDLYPDGALGELRGWHQTTKQSSAQRSQKRHAMTVLQVAGAKIDPLTPSQMEEVKRARRIVNG